MSEARYLAFDLGASSGRAIVGKLESGKISVCEIHRFENGMTDFNGGLHWNIIDLYKSLLKSLEIYTQRFKGPLKSLAIDTWGVDFGLLDRDSSLIGLPYAYRDPRTKGAMESFFAKLPRQRLYELTGIQLLPLNTVFQLEAMRRGDSPQLEIADDLLFIPDLLNYLLSGEKRSEFTFATTSQLYNPQTRSWEKEIFDALGISHEIMQKIVMPGETIGTLKPEVAAACGIEPVPVVAVASHDTGSAVAAVPAQGKNWAFISSGTWSLMGIESDEPIINDKTLKYNITNEGGASGNFRVLKNITGLWIMQECRRAWSKSLNHSFGELVELASKAEPFVSLIDPDHEDFASPTDMPKAIADYCARTGQIVPQTPGQITRAVLESLALKYRFVLEQLSEVSAQPIERLHIIGGGIKNRLLCGFTASACKLPVTAGPKEATAIGNLLMQAWADGEISSLGQLREVVRNSVKLDEYRPEQPESWDAAYKRFCELNPR